MSKEFPGEKLLIKVIDDLADFLPYLVYYMLRFNPKKEQFTNDVASLIKKQEEGRQVKENLKKYFSSVNSKGPLFVEQENGPDAYIADVKKDVFDKFSQL